MLDSIPYFYFYYYEIFKLKREYLPCVGISIANNRICAKISFSPITIDSADPIVNPTVERLIIRCATVRKCTNPTAEIINLPAYPRADRPPVPETGYSRLPPPRPKQAALRRNRLRRSLAPLPLPLPSARGFVFVVL